MLLWFCIFILSGGLLTSNISSSQSGNKATEQCNLSTNQVDITPFAFIFSQTPIQSRHPPLPILRRQKTQKEEIHGMERGP